MGSDRTGNDIQLSKNNVKSVMHEHNDRISDDAAIRMAYEVELDIHRKTQAARLVANGKGRQTIKEEDIVLVNNIIDVMQGDE